ncbi:chemotaxis protein CheR [soil metagenome]
MRRTVGLSLSEGKVNFVANRLGARIQALELGGYSDYHRLIADGDTQGEFQVAVDLLTTNETYFFREQAHFDLLEKEFSRTPRQALSIWSAASSFGDEAYSVAMLLSEMQVKGQVAEGWSILGTDISDRALQTAVRGIYPEERVRNVPPQLLRRHCLRGTGEDAGLVQIGPKLRPHVHFGRINLCEPFDNIGLFDVILLRNVLIYFDGETKLDVVDRVLEHLRPGGIFMVGTGEGRIASTQPLDALAPGAWRKPTRN